MGKRFDYVDIARGLGIMLVIMGHIEYAYVPFCGSVHIPLFFILSGYLYDMERPCTASYGETVRKRVKRLLIPYFVYNLILYAKYLLKLVLTHEFTMELGLKGLLGFVYSSSLFYKNVPAENNLEGFVFGNGPLWFLTAMAVASVFFYIIIYYVLKHRFDVRKIAVSSLILCVVSWMLCRFLPVYLPWSFEMALLGCVFMLIGLCMRRYNIVKILQKHVWIPLVCLVVFALLHHFNGPANMAVQDYGKSMLVYLMLGTLGSVMVIFISLILEKVTVIRCAVSYVGQNTLIILAFHMTIISVMVSVLGKIGFNWLLDWGGFFAIRFFVGLFGCLILNEILTRVLKVPKRFL
ncbi:MAG: acyltransferase [Thermoflexaceae bacterium]|nr:acyltransferase [Thermoflexaceae bacterium]